MYLHSLQWPSSSDFSLCHCALSTVGWPLIEDTALAVLRVGRVCLQPAIVGGLPDQSILDTLHLGKRRSQPGACASLHDPINDCLCDPRLRMLPWCRPAEKW